MCCGLLAFGLRGAQNRAEILHNPVPLNYGSHGDTLYVGSCRILAYCTKPTALMLYIKDHKNAFSATSNPKPPETQTPTPTQPKRCKSYIVFGSFGRLRSLLRAERFCGTL